MIEEPRTIGYAVVGLGWISQAAMLPAFANARSNSRLTALVSGDAVKRAELARRYHLPPAATFEYDDYERCLERDDVDAVYIAVPNHLHREYTIRAAEKGVHVLCEKPMAVTPDECREMMAACAGNGVKLMVAYRLHLDPANLHAVRRVMEGAIGGTRVFTSTFTQQVQQGDIRLMPSAKGGGPLYDIGIYCINAARYLFRSEPGAVLGVRCSRPQERFESAEEAIACVLRFPEDRLASFVCSFGAAPLSVFNLVGDDGEMRMDQVFNFEGDRAFRMAGREGSETLTFPDADQFGPQLLYFSDCILEDGEPEPSGEEGLVDVAIIRALYESLESGREIALDLPTRSRRPVPDQARECPAIETPELVHADEPGN